MLEPKPEGRYQRRRKGKQYLFLTKMALTQMVSDLRSEKRAATCIDMAVNDGGGCRLCKYWASELGEHQRLKYQLPVFEEDCDSVMGVMRVLMMDGIARS